MRDQALPGRRAEAAQVLTGTYGTSDEAWIAALTGEIVPQGRLPFELPSSMEAVRRSREDVANDTADPTFACRHGLDFPGAPAS